MHKYETINLFIPEFFKCIKENPEMSRTGLRENKFMEYLEFLLQKPSKPSNIPGT
jgi:hypothetical protein